MGAMPPHPRDGRTLLGHLGWGAHTHRIRPLVRELRSAVRVSYGGVYVILHGEVQNVEVRADDEVAGRGIVGIARGLQTEQAAGEKHDVETDRSGLAAKARRRDVLRSARAGRASTFGSKSPISSAIVTMLSSHRLSSPPSRTRPSLLLQQVQEQLQHSHLRRNELQLGDEK
jgi:hypothetical protein